MKYLDEYRDDDVSRALLDDIARIATRPWTIMEVCGGQTHTLIRQGIDQLLPAEVELVHGPGCPVCVTPVALIDEAIAIAKRPDTILCSFGDMLRVPGSSEDLFHARAAGGDARVVYSPLDALEVARRNPDKTVVFFAVGFETTAPANAMAVRQAKLLGVTNFALLVAHVLVPPGDHGDPRLAGEPRAGVPGAGPRLRDPGVARVRADRAGLRRAARRHGVRAGRPAGRHPDAGATARGGPDRGGEPVRARGQRDGNPAALAVVDEVFEVADRAWRGIGVIPASGLRLREAYAMHDAERLFPHEGGVPASESEICIAGDVLRGRAKPHDCPAFGTLCTPETPLGAPMVSTEGACAAYFLAGRTREGASA